MGLWSEKKANSSLRTLRVKSESLFGDDNVLTVSVEVAGELQVRTRQVVAERIFAESPSRLYHMTCGGETTWFGFAQAILADLERPHAQLEPISTNEYPTPARRPRYSVLSNARLAEDFGIRLPHWQEAFTAMNGQMP